MVDALDDFFVELTVDSILRGAELDKAIITIGHERARALGKGLPERDYVACCEARYIRGIHEGMEHFSHHYLREALLAGLRKKLGAERYDLYFGEN